MLLQSLILLLSLCWFIIYQPLGCVRASAFPDLLHIIVSSAILSTILFLSMSILSALSLMQEFPMVWLSQVLMRRFLFQFLDMISMITTIMMIDCNGNSNIMLLRMKSKPPLCFQIIWVGWLNAQGKEVKALFANPDFDVFSSLPSLLNIWLYLYHICCLLLASAIFAF